MTPTDFAQPAGELVQIGTGADVYWAFVPAPLPPLMPVDDALLMQLSAADRAVGELAGVARNIPNPRLLIQPFVRREAVLSSKIEGTQTDVAGLYAFEAEQRHAGGRAAVRTPEDADRFEVFNYVRAAEYGLEQLKKRPVTLNLIRELHERLTEGVRGGEAAPGEFRRVQNMIGGKPGLPQSARFVPPPVSHLAAALDAFEKYVNAPHERPPLLRLALAHYQFETIHPFRDGNGRIGRLLISLLLSAWNILPQPLLHLSAFFERLRIEYCDHLLGVSQRSDWAGWAKFFLAGVQEQAVDAARRAKGLLDLQLNWRKQVQEAGGTGLMLAIVDLLFESPFTWSSDVSARFKVSAPTALGTLRRLEGLGILRVVPVGRRQLFFATQIIDSVK